MTETAESPLPPEPNGVYRARLDYVFDMNTVSMLLDLGFHTYRRVVITLRGIKRSESADEEELATRWLRQWFDQMTQAVDPINLLGLPFIFRVKVHGTAGGDRWYGDVWLYNGSMPLNEQYLMTDLVKRQE